MKRVTLSGAFFLTALALIATGTACNSNELGGCAPGAAGCTDPNNPQPVAEYSSLEVDPPQAMISTTNGMPVQQRFTVRGRRPDGSLSDALTARWTVPPTGIGTIDQNTGVFTASGEVGGSVDVTVTVQSNGANVSTVFKVVVSVQKDVVVTGAPADAASKFAGKTPMSDAAKSALILYPRTGVVMPQNVFAPDVQWEEKGAAGDLYRVRFTKPNLTVNSYVAYSGGTFKFDWLVDSSVWRGVTQTNPEQETRLTVDRYEASSGNVYTSGDVSIRFVKGALLGSIYYWEIRDGNFGRVMRIDDGTNQRVQLIATPPTSPIDNSNCMGCHTVSRDGRYMFGRLGGASNVGTLFDLTKDLSKSPVPTEYPVTNTLPQFFFASFNADASRLLTSQYGTLGLVNAKTGMNTPLAAGSTALPNANATYPTWSPDGKTIAYTSEANSWGDQVTAGNLSIIPVTGADSFGAPQRIHTASSIATMTMDAYPSWSPDSKWIVFHNGRNSRSDANDPNGALLLIAPTGGATIQLSKAVGGTGRSNVFIPNFSPFITNGYYWLTFLSRQPYGNSKAGTAGRNIQQVWVTGIKINPTPGEDPSEVSYWLPGQDTLQANISAYWAPRACKPDTEMCTNDGQCCGGVCQGGKCAAPPSMCLGEFQGCGSDASCCQGLRCDPLIHQCVRPIG